MIDYRFSKDIALESAAEILCEEYIQSSEFRTATISSIRSAMRESEGMDEQERARLIADRIFGRR